VIFDYKHNPLSREWQGVCGVPNYAIVLWRREVHNEEDESWGRYAAACIRQLHVGVGFVRNDDREVLVQLQEVAGPATAQVIHFMLEEGVAAVWFFTALTDLKDHRDLTEWECALCRTVIQRQGWCVWVRGLLPSLPTLYHRADSPSH
jgi:hypothetical protein